MLYVFFGTLFFTVPSALAEPKVAEMGGKRGAQMERQHTEGTLVFCCARQ